MTGPRGSRRCGGAKDKRWSLPRNSKQQFAQRDRNAKRDTIHDFAKLEGSSKEKMKSRPEVWWFVVNLKKQRRQLDTHGGCVGVIVLDWLLSLLAEFGLLSRYVAGAVVVLMARGRMDLLLFVRSQATTARGNVEGGRERLERMGRIEGDGRGEGRSRRTGVGGGCAGRKRIGRDCLLQPRDSPVGSARVEVSERRAADEVRPGPRHWQHDLSRPQVDRQATPYLTYQTGTGTGTTPRRPPPRLRGESIIPMLRHPSPPWLGACRPPSPRQHR